MIYLILFICVISIPYRPYTTLNKRKSRNLISLGIIPINNLEVGKIATRNRGGDRKVRSDKKVDVKPTISTALKEKLYTFAYLCNEPVKDIAEKLCTDATESKFVIDEICKWFRRKYIYSNRLVYGYMDRPKLKLITNGETSKVTIKFVQNNYEKVKELSNALDLTPTSTAAVLIKITLQNREFMEYYINKHLQYLTKSKVEAIRKLLNL